MKKSEINLLILEIVSILLLFINIFIKNYLNYWLIILMMVISFIITYIMLGFEKERKQHRKSIIKLLVFFTISFLILIYGIGFYTGFNKNVYSLSIINIIKNLFPVIVLVFATELYRYNLCKKGSKSRVLFLVTIILFVMFDLSIAIEHYDTNNIENIIELFTLILLPSITKNILLCDFAKKYGYSDCIVYNLIMSSYIYLVPILPNLDKYLETIILFLFPILIKIIINYRFEEKKKTSFRNKNIVSKIIVGIIIVITLVVIMLTSNLFRFWVAVVGSGSMEPTINIGDIVIVDKSYQKHLDKLQENDILVFKINNSIYTHRIIKIEKENSDYKITTKGDREGNVVDNWTVKKENVVGVVKRKIPYVGYPTVWLTNLIKEGNK